LPASDRRPTVALVSDSSGWGGAEVYLASLAAHLGARWQFVALVGEHAAAELVAQLVQAGADVRTIRGLGRRPRPLAILRAIRALREIRPAVVHVSLTDQGDGLAPLAAAWCCGPTTIAMLHLVIPGRAKGREWVSRRALRLPQLVIGGSAHVAAYAREAGAQSRAVMYGVDPPVQAPEPRASLGLPPYAPVVGGIGRIDIQKGWDVLCRAMPLVRARVPDARCVVIGDGPALSGLRGLAAETGVSFVGYRERASSLVGAFDVLAVPSRYEAFGLVAAEAMMAGVPVVASAVGGIPEVVGDTGLLVRPERPDELADAIVEVLRDRSHARERGERGRVRAFRLFTAARMAGEVDDLYRELTLQAELPSTSSFRRAFGRLGG